MLIYCVLSTRFVSASKKSQAYYTGSSGRLDAMDTYHLTEWTLLLAVRIGRCQSTYQVNSRPQVSSSRHPNEQGLHTKPPPKPQGMKRLLRNESFLLTGQNSELAKEIDGLGATRHCASPNWHSQQRPQSKRVRTTSLPASEWPHRNHSTPASKSYEFWHPAVKGTGIFPLSTALDKPKT